MKLNQYPNRIAELERQALALDRRLRQVRETQGLLLAEIDEAIAFDPALRNEAQRKAARARQTDLTQETPYAQTAHKLNGLIDERQALEISLTCLRNEFAIAKLEARERIGDILPTLMLTHRERASQ